LTKLGPVNGQQKRPIDRPLCVKLENAIRKKARTDEMEDHETDIHARLQKLGEQLRHAEAKFKLEDPVTLDDKVTGAELRARYNALLDRVGANVRDAEKHGRHVSDLEYSIRLWLGT
jgi:hypothetical protein